MKIRRRLTVPDYITISRIIGSVGLIFTIPFSIGFYMVYTFCGLSDVLDGLVARATKTTSDFGAKLDSIADLLFYGVTAWHIIPVLWKILPVVIWYGLGVIVLVRIASYGIAAYKYHRFASLHTYGNKLTGAAVFLIPYFMAGLNTTAVCSVACSIALIASFEELLMHLISKTYQPEKKTIIQYIH